MTSKEELLRIADRCEREEPSRHLDEVVFCATANDEALEKMQRAPPYTTSLDAAVTLVPEGWNPSDLCWEYGEYGFCLLHEGSWRSASAKAKTEPLARTAAALRAKVADMQARAEDGAPHPSRAA